MKCCRWHAARAGTSLVGARCSGRRRRIGLRRRAAREPDCIDVKSLESHRPPPAGPLRTSQITVPPRRRHCEKKIPTCDSSYGFNSTARRRQKSLTVIKKLERPAGGAVRGRTHAAITAIRAPRVSHQCAMHAILDNNDVKHKTRANRKSLYQTLAHRG